VVVGGAFAAAAFGASPLADHLKPGGPARTTDAGGAAPDIDADRHRRGAAPD
jgi:hypothetical protein